MSVRRERVGSAIKQNLYKVLLKDFDNPVIKAVAITKVDVSPDLGKAYVGVKSLNGEHALGVKNLQKASGLIKKKMAVDLYLKRMPELIFVDSSKID